MLLVKYKSLGNNEQLFSSADQASFILKDFLMSKRSRDFKKARMLGTPKPPLVVGAKILHFATLTLFWFKKVKIIFSILSTISSGGDKMEPTYVIWGNKKHLMR